MYDTGVGIRDDQLPLLFKPFGQLQECSGGTGLGLYTVYEKASSLSNLEVLHQSGSLSRALLLARARALSLSLSRPPSLPPSLSLAFPPSLAHPYTRVTNKYDMKSILCRCGQIDLY